MATRVQWPPEGTAQRSSPLSWEVLGAALLCGRWAGQGGSSERVRRVPPGGAADRHTSRRLAAKELARVMVGLAGQVLNPGAGGRKGRCWGCSQWATPAVRTPPFGSQGPSPMGEPAPLWEVSSFEAGWLQVSAPPTDPLVLTQTRVCTPGDRSLARWTHRLAVTERTHPLDCACPPSPVSPGSQPTRQLSHPPVLPGGPSRRALVLQDWLLGLPCSPSPLPASALAGLSTLASNRWYFFAQKPGGQSRAVSGLPRGLMVPALQSPPASPGC